MANPWFKFYGIEYLSDPKTRNFTAEQHSCWLHLLCFASNSSKPGTVEHLTEESLMIYAGVDPKGVTQGSEKGMLNLFEELGMIKINDNKVTIRNWKKRQETRSESYERVKRFREKRNVTETLNNDRKEKNREEKNREDTKPHASISYLTNIPLEDIKEFTDRFDVTKKQVLSKGEDLLNWCESNGKRKKNYKKFLLNAIKRDYSERSEEDRTKPRMRPKLDENGSPVILNGSVVMETV